MEWACERVEGFLRRRIPLACALNCRVEAFDGEAIALRAPKFANTANGPGLFEGSSLAVGLLSAWTLLTLGLQRLDYAATLSLTRLECSAIPVFGGGIRAYAALPSEREWQQALRRFARKGKARIGVEVRLELAVGVDATLSCLYDALELDEPERPLG